MKHFDRASSLMPKDDDPQNKEFVSSRMSDMAKSLYAASENSGNPQSDEAKAAALSYARETLAKDPSDAASHYIFGMQALESKNYAEAEKQLKSAISKDSDNAMYYYQLGRSQAQQKKYDAASVSFQSSVKYDSNFAPAYYNLGFVSERLGRNSQALGAYRRASSVNPDYENAYIAAARILSRQNDFNGAVSAYESAVRVNPSNARTYQEMGSAYSSLEKYKQAEDCFKKALAYMDPSNKDPLTYYNLSTVMYAQGNRESALEYAALAYANKDAGRKAARSSIVYNYALMNEEAGNFTRQLTFTAKLLRKIQKM